MTGSIRARGEEVSAAFVDDSIGTGMGLIRDFVPTTWASARRQCWWLEVREWGRSSPFAIFDI